MVKMKAEGLQAPLKHTIAGLGGASPGDIEAISGQTSDHRGAEIKFALSPKALLLTPCWLSKM